LKIDSLRDNIAILLSKKAKENGSAIALYFKEQQVSYRQLYIDSCRLAKKLRQLGISTGERIAIYLPKQPETVVAIFATAIADGVFVPVNPQLKANQVQHILQDAGVAVLVTSAQRWRQLQPLIYQNQQALKVLIIDEHGTEELNLVADSDELNYYRSGDDLAALMYTSGSTGLPKGVMFSHTNIIAGAHSVTQYLCNHSEDRLLALLPFSFDYGLNQLFSAIYVGAGLVLMEFLLPHDVIKNIVRHQVTGVAGVPPLWSQLANLDWSDCHSVRYITNSGGALPHQMASHYQQILPNAQVFLMYGLTEAFRSTYLEPDLLHERKGSMGKAIPGAEIHVVDQQGNPVQTGEVGELVHRGIHVSKGYWNAPEKTAERFKPLPGITEDGELAVWSGDLVKKDVDGFLYFVSRNDEMIKTSGYRVSPAEVEQCLLEIDTVTQAVVFGVADQQLGQKIIAVVESAEATIINNVKRHCMKQLPSFMQPREILVETLLPRSANGKIDRAGIKLAYQSANTK